MRNGHGTGRFAWRFPHDGHQGSPMCTARILQVPHMTEHPYGMSLDDRTCSGQKDVKTQTGDPFERWGDTWPELARRTRRRVEERWQVASAPSPDKATTRSKSWRRSARCRWFNKPAASERPLGGTPWRTAVERMGDLFHHRNRCRPDVFRRWPPKLAEDVLRQSHQHHLGAETSFDKP